MIANKHVMKYAFVMLIYILSTACTHTSGTGSEKFNVWDSESGVYYIPSNGLEYAIDSANILVVVSPETLPEYIDMCALDTANSTCVTIINATEAEGIDKSAANCTDDEIRNLACNISYNKNSNEKLGDLKTERTKFLGNDAWKFSLDKFSVQGTDTIGATYIGYVFDGKNYLAVIVVTFPVGETNDSTNRFVNSYLLNLKRTNL